MQIDQKYGNYRTSFTFNDDKLDYIFSRSHIKTGGSIAYEKIPAQFTRRNAHLFWKTKYLGLLFAVIGVLLAKFGLVHGTANSAQILLVFAGVGALLVFIPLFGKNPTITTFYAEPAIHVLNDAQYQTILEELGKRRIASQRRKFMEVDFLKQPNQEYEKFRFLRNEGIISEREFTDAVSKLIASQQHKTTNYVS